MIPAEAVEAAAKEMRARKDQETTFGEVARAALEAAAPYMLAQAWEQGWDTFASFDSRPGGPYPTNPYMLNTEGEK